MSCKGKLETLQSLLDINNSLKKKKKQKHKWTMNFLEAFCSLSTDSHTRFPYIMCYFSLYLAPVLTSLGKIISNNKHSLMSLCVFTCFKFYDKT